jgi:hypothetical protein
VARVGRLRRLLPLRGHGLGQSLVEFAIVLPVLLLLLGGAIDMGRLFFAQVAVENAAKEGALFGATTPGCDTVKTGCVEPRTVAWHVEEETGGLAPLSHTVQCIDGGTPVALTACEENDTYVVSVSHTFRLVTPILSALFGTGLQLNASATAVVLNETFDPNATPFPMPSPASPSPSPSFGSCTVPDFTGTRANDAAGTWSTAGFSGAVTTDGSGNFIIQGQSLPVGSTQLCSSGITVSDSGGPTPVPTATPAPTPACSVVPDLVGMTVSQARSAWTGAGFTGAFAPANGSNSKTVLSQATNPVASPGQCVTPTTSVTVAHS